MAERQYSVSLPRHRSSTGPKPIEKRSTPTPVHRATKKWPSSWIRINTPMTMTNETIVVTRLPPSDPRVDERLDTAASLGIDGDALLDRGEWRRRDGGQPTLDELHDGCEANALVEERRNRDLVRRVQHDGCDSARLEGGTRETQAGELVEVRLEER